MHCNNLGIGQKSNASGMLHLCDAGLFGDPTDYTLDARVKICHDEFKAWKKRNKISCSEPVFSVTRSICFVS